LPVFCIVVYREYKYRVLPSYINTYFATKSYKLNKKEQQKVEDKVLQINRLIKNKEILRRSNFTFLLPISIPIAVLGRPEENRLQYREYQYIYCTIQGIYTY
jgi:hypothetical protein